jgi:hypothetical protein
VIFHSYVSLPEVIGFVWGHAHFQQQHEHRSATQSFVNIVFLRLVLSFYGGNVDDKEKNCTQKTLHIVKWWFYGMLMKSCWHVDISYTAQF